MSSYQEKPNTQVRLELAWDNILWKVSSFKGGDKERLVLCSWHWLTFEQTFSVFFRRICYSRVIATAGALLVCLLLCSKRVSLKEPASIAGSLGVFYSVFWLTALIKWHSFPVSDMAYTQRTRPQQSWKPFVWQTKDVCLCLETFVELLLTENELFNKLGVVFNLSIRN